MNRIEELEQTLNEVLEWLGDFCVASPEDAPEVELYSRSVEILNKKNTEIPVS